MHESIHGHKVLNLIKSQSQPLSLDQQIESLTDHFGSNSQYHTCSAQGLSAEQLLTLFIEKGKLANNNGQIIFVGCQCGH